MRFPRFTGRALTLCAGLILHPATTTYAFGQDFVAVGNNSFQEERTDSGLVNLTSGPGGVAFLSVRNFDSLADAAISSGVVSFDLTNVLTPGTDIESASLLLNVTSFTDSTTGVQVESFSYDPERPQDFFSFAPLTDQGLFSVDNLGQIQVELSDPDALEVASDRAIGIRLSGGSTANVSFDGTTVFDSARIPRLSVTLVPEPASAALLLLGAAGIMGRRRRG